MSPSTGLIGRLRELGHSHAPFARFEKDWFSYAAVFDRVKRRVAWLREQGIRQGDRVAIYSSDAFELMITLFASWGARAVLVPMNVSQPPEKLRQIEAIAEPKLGIFSPGYEPEEGAAFRRVSVPEEEPESIELLVEPQPDDLSVVMFTSGTSGVPKAVPIRYGAISANSRATAGRLGVGPEDRILINSPPYYTSPIIHHLTMLWSGGSVVATQGLLFGGGLLDLLKQHECTGFGGVPVHLERILGALEEAEAPQTLRFLMNSGEHLPVPVLKRLIDRLPQVQVFCVYGLTEVAGRLCILDSDRVRDKLGSVGTPLEGMQISIRGEEGATLGRGETGEVHVSGPMLMPGYLRAEAINQQVMGPLGFATGDLGYLDDEGFLFLEGRKDDVIKVGGEKVSLKSIEEVLYDFEDFEAFAVVSDYDPHLGTVPSIRYVLKPNRSFLRKQLVRFLKARLPASHVPSHFQQVDEIRRAGSGKRSRT